MKEKIVTRTVTTLLVRVVGIDNENNVVIKEAEIPVMDEKKIMPFLMSKATDSFTPAKIRSIEQVEQLYGMPESVFIAHATKLPPRKDYNTEKEEG